EDLGAMRSELAVAVTDEKPRPDAFVAQLHQQIARLLGHPAAVRIGRDPGEVDAPARKLDEEQHVEALQEERVDGEEVAPGRRRGYVQRRTTSSRCQRRSVAGVTNTDDFQRCRDSTRLSAVKSARSACGSCGRAT